MPTKRQNRAERNRFVQPLLAVVPVAAVAYLGLCAWLYVRQAHYLYFPGRQVACTPADAGLAFEDLTLTTADGVRLAAWYVPAENARATLLHCHGNAGNIGDRVDIVRLYHNLGLNVLIFDYRGYGRSSGTPTEPGTYADALAAWTYLTVTRGIPPQAIVVGGQSLGCGVASWLAAQVKPGALILESGFTSVPDMAARIYPFLPARRLARIRYDSLERLPRVTCPVLVAHSPDDEIVPYAFGQRLFEAANQPKEFLVLQGSHNDGYIDTGPAYGATIIRFVDRHIARAMPGNAPP